MSERKEIAVPPAALQGQAERRTDASPEAATGSDEPRRRAALEPQLHPAEESHDAAAVGYVTLDARGTVCDANAIAARQLGIDRVQLIGKSFERLVAPESQNAWLQQRRALWAGLSSASFELVLRGEGGRSFHAQIAASPLLAAADSGPRPLRMAVSSGALGGAQPHAVHGVLDALPLLVSYLGDDQRYRFNNAPYENWFGVPRQALEGSHAREVIGGAAYERVQDCIVRALAGEPVRFEGELSYSRVGRRWVSIVYAPDIAVTGTVRGFYCMVHDQTSLRRAEQALRESAAQVVFAEQRERRSLAADLHDDVGQLLSLAAMQLGMLGDQRGSEAQALRAQIDDLLKQARQRISSLSFQLSPPVLYDVGLRAAAQWLAADIGRRYALAVHLEAGPELEDLDEVTRVTLFRALRELLVNAARHAHSKVVWVGLRESGRFVELEVRDTGVGFNAQTAPLGFGLASVRSRVEHLGGTLEIESRPGSGTSVAIRVPLGRVGKGAS